MKSEVTGSQRLMAQLLSLTLAFGSAAPTMAAPAEPRDKDRTAAKAALPHGEATETDSPDLPGKGSASMDMTKYLAARGHGVALRRGVASLAKDPTARSRAIRQMERQEVAVAARRANGSLEQSVAPLVSVPSTWTPIGPTPIPNGQTTNRSDAVSGRITAIAVDPTDANIVYAGTAQGGVFRTSDASASPAVWTAIFDSAQSLAIGALAIAPSDHTKLYVGTGENNLNGDGFFGVGLYRIDNATTTATLVGPINPIVSPTPGGTVGAFTGRSIGKIVVNPTNPAIIWMAVGFGIGGSGGDQKNDVAAAYGLYRSTNATAAAGSVAFTRFTNGVGLPYMDLAYDGGSDTLFLSNYGSTAANGGVWRFASASTAPAGTALTKIRTTAAGRNNIAFNNPGGSAPKLFIATSENPGTCGGEAGLVYQSTSTPLAGAVTFSSIAGSAGFCGGQCFYDMPIEVSPTNSDELYLGGPGNGTCARNYKHSTNATGLGTFVADQDGLHADGHALTVAPSNTNIVYYGNDGGIWRSTDKGVNWTSLNNGTLSATQFESIAQHKSDREFMIGGTQDNGTEMRKPDGTWVRADYGDGGYARMDQSGSSTQNVTMYHTYYNFTGAGGLLGFARTKSRLCAVEAQWSFLGAYDPPVDPTVHCDGSTDTFNGISLGDETALFYSPLELGPGTPNTVYFGSNHLYRSADKGDTVTDVSGTLGLFGPAAISTIAISPQDDNYRLVGAEDGCLYGTTTGGTTLPGDFFGCAVFPFEFTGRVLFNPKNKQEAFAAYSGYMTAAGGQIWKTSNFSAAVADAPGGDWVQVGDVAHGLPNVPVNAMAIDKNDTNHVYAGTDIGVFYSANGGTTWAPYSTGLPRVAIFDMVIQPTNSLLRVATHGRGIWEVATAAPSSAELALSGTVADYSIVKTDTSSFNYTITNNGPITATGVTLLDSVPAGLTIGSIPSSQGSCAAIGQDITCNLGTLASMATATVTVNVTGNTVGTQMNTATLSANEYDNNPANNSITKSLRVLDIAAIHPSSGVMPIGGCTTPGGTVSLTMAHTADLHVDLSSDDASLAISPSTLTIPAGSMSASFTLTSTQVSAATPATISAQLQESGTTVTKGWTVEPEKVTVLTLTPSTVTGGNSSTAGVTISCANSSAVTVNFTNTYTTVATPVPSSISITAGNTTGSTTINTVAVSSTKSVKVVANAPGGGKNATLTVNP